MNNVVKKWASHCLGTGKYAGRIGTGLDESEIVSVVISGLKDAEGKRRSPKRACSYVSTMHNNNATTITYGAVLAVSSDASSKHVVFKSYLEALVEVDRLKKELARSDRVMSALSSVAQGADIPQGSNDPQRNVAAERLRRKQQKRRLKKKQGKASAVKSLTDAVAGVVLSAVFADGVTAGSSSPIESSPMQGEVVLDSPTQVEA
jgi:hypothetical protein